MSLLNPPRTALVEGGRGGGPKCPGKCSKCAKTYLFLETAGNPNVVAETSRLLLERARASPAGLDRETRQDVGNRRRRPHSLKRRAKGGDWGGTTPRNSWPTPPRWRYLCSWRPGFVLLLEFPGSCGKRLIDFLPCPRGEGGLTPPPCPRKSAYGGLPTRHAFAAEGETPGRRRWALRGNSAAAHYPEAGASAWGTTNSFPCHTCRKASGRGEGGRSA